MQNDIFIIMNLQEQINRIQGLINEDKVNIIKNMISKHGLYHTIQLMGNYENILNHINHEEISDEDKIVYIKEVVNELTKLYGGSGLSTHETGMLPVNYSRDKYITKWIDYFGKEEVVIDSYQNYGYEKYLGNVSCKYEDLPTDVFDNVFIWMIDLLEKQ
jgi:hypothetical protein